MRRGNGADQADAGGMDGVGVGRRRRGAASSLSVGGISIWAAKAGSSSALGQHIADAPSI